MERQDSADTATPPQLHQAVDVVGNAKRSVLKRLWDVVSGWFSGGDSSIAIQGYRKEIVDYAVKTGNFDIANKLPIATTKIIGPPHLGGHRLVYKLNDDKRLGKNSLKFQLGSK